MEMGAGVKGRDNHQRRGNGRKWVQNRNSFSPNAPGGKRGSRRESQIPVSGGGAFQEAAPQLKELHFAGSVGPSPGPQSLASLPGWEMKNHCPFGGLILHSPLLLF